MDRPSSLSEPPKSQIRKVFAKCRVNCYVTRSITDLADVIRGMSGWSFFPAKTKKVTPIYLFDLSVLWYYHIIPQSSLVRLTGQSLI